MLIICLSTNQGSSQLAEPQFLTPLYDSIANCYPYDYEGDGDQDIILTSFTESFLGVVIHKEPGVHDGLVHLETTNLPVAEFLISDINGDGLEDLMLWSDSLNRLTCFPQTGEGPGEEITMLESLTAIVDLQFIDLNGDAKGDMLYVTGFGIYYRLALDGFMLGPSIYVSSTSSAITAMLAGDTDLDGDNDLLVAAGMNLILYNRNDLGGFDPGTVVGTGGVTKMIQLIQVMGSPEPEIFFGGASLTWLMNYAGNSFGESNYISGSAYDGEMSVIAADVDIDGDLDLMVARKSDVGSGAVKYYTNTGSTFTSGTYDFAQIQGGLMSGADMDMDGDIDFLNQQPFGFFGNSEKHFFWYENTYPLNLGESKSRIPIFPHHVKKNGSSTQGKSSIAVSDLDMDGDNDLVLATLYKLFWYPNNGDGTFGDPHKISFPNEVNPNTDIMIADYDLDGDPDIFYYTSKWVNDGTGHFSPGAFSMPISPWTCDVNNDSYLDYYTITSNYLMIYYGNAGGVYGSPVLVSHNYGSLNVTASHCGDFTGNGIKDDIVFIVNNPSSSGVLRFKRTTSDDSFYSNYLTTCDAASAPLISDFDHDDDTDIKCMESFVWNETGGVYTPGNTIEMSDEDHEFLLGMNTMSTNRQFLYTADIDHDDNNDFLLYSRQSTRKDLVAWVEVNVTDSLQPTVIINQGLIDSDNYMAADLDGDGDPEIICTCRYGSVCIRENLYNSNDNYSVAAKLFNDLNNNGSFDADEPGANGAAISFLPEGTLHFMGSEEFITIPSVAGNYQLVPSTENPLWQPSGADTLSILLSGATPHDTLYIPFMHSEPGIQYFASSYGYACDAPVHILAGINNGSDASFSTNFKIDLGAGLSLLSSTLSPDSVLENTFYFTVNDLPAGTDSIIDIMVSPSTEIPDTIVHNEIFFYIGDEVLYAQAFPVSFDCADSLFHVVAMNGIYEASFIPLGSDVLYAFTYADSNYYEGDNLIITDSLPVGVIAESMEILYNTYPMNVSIDMSGNVDMMMENYYSTEGCNPVLFHAVLRFQTESGLAAGTILQSAATVYPGLSAYTVSNCFHTLFDCSLNADIISEEDTLCSGSQLMADDLFNMAESDYWSLDGSIIDLPADVPFGTETASLILTTSNIYCFDTDTLSLVVIPVDSMLIHFSPSDSTITAPEGLSAYMWFLNGELIPGADSTSIHIVQNGTYSVQALMVSGCTSVSNNLYAAIDCEPSDLNCDGIVSLTDLDILIANYGCMWDCSAYDLNGDNIIGASDIIIMIGDLE